MNEEIKRLLDETRIKRVIKVHPPPRKKKARARPRGMREIVYLDRVEIHIWQ
ncbi:MAG: hypothetical protein L3J47_12095 [Sulfurovum sp.]|nr:hypothetical protein [Sulfurovum sp.]